MRLLDRNRTAPIELMYYVLAYIIDLFQLIAETTKYNLKLKKKFDDKQSEMSFFSFLLSYWCMRELKQDMNHHTTNFEFEFEYVNYT